MADLLRGLGIGVRCRILSAHNVRLTVIILADASLLREMRLEDAFEHGLLRRPNLSGDALVTQLVLRRQKRVFVLHLNALVRPDGRANIKGVMRLVYALAVLGRMGVRDGG